MFLDYLTAELYYRTCYINHFVEMQFIWTLLYKQFYTTRTIDSYQRLRSCCRGSKKGWNCAFSKNREWEGALLNFHRFWNKEISLFAVSENRNDINPLTTKVPHDIATNLFAKQWFLYSGEQWSVMG